MPPATPATPGGMVAVGCAVCYTGWSTWTGRVICLEDLYIAPAARRGGVGSTLLRGCALAAAAGDCARLAWNCLDWNTPAMCMYTDLGAERLREWVGYRLGREGIARVAGGESHVRGEEGGGSVV